MTPRAKRLVPLVVLTVACAALLAMVAIWQTASRFDETECAVLPDPASSAELVVVHSCLSHACMHDAYVRGDSLFETHLGRVNLDEDDLCQDLSAQWDHDAVVLSRGTWSQRLPL